MGEIEKLLKENIVDYEAAKRAAERERKENYAELSKRFCYAEKLSLPIRKNQAFFIWDERKPAAELVKLLMEQLPLVCGGDLRVLYYAKVGGKDGIAYDSEEYWEALACSGYLISNVPLPAAYVKRDGQTYFNELPAAYGRESYGDPEWISLLSREFLKTDVTLGASAETVRETWGKSADLLGIYEGTVLLCEEPAAHAREIAEAIVECAGQEVCAVAGESASAEAESAAGAGTENAASAELENAGGTGTENAVGAGVESAASAESENATGTAVDAAGGSTQAVGRLVPENTEKKRILVLTAWKMPAERRAVVKRLLADPAFGGSDVTVLSALADAPELLADFCALPTDGARLMYRGRMVLTEQEFLIYRMLEKNLDVCMECPELAEERNRLIQREWRRIWGGRRFDVCLILGGSGRQQYHMAMAGNFGKRILVDLDFLESFREKAPVKWSRALAGFDEIFCLPAGKSLGAYGAENKDRVRRLPVFSRQDDMAGAGISGGENDSPAHTGEMVKYGGREYVVCGGRKENGRQRLTLLELPNPGTVLGLGGFRAEERLWKYLYFLPVADRFFERLSGCIRNPALEYDAVAEICKARGVPILSPEEGKGVLPS